MKKNGLQRTHDKNGWVYGLINKNSYPCPTAIIANEEETKEEKELSKLIQSIPKRKTGRKKEDS